MALLTETALADMREYIKRRIDHAQYKLGSVWHKEYLESVTINGNVVKIKFMIEPDTAGTVTQVQLIDTDSQVWYDKSVRLKMADVSEGYAYVVRIGITETEEES